MTDGSRLPSEISFCTPVANTRKLSLYFGLGKKHPLHALSKNQNNEKKTWNASLQCTRLVHSSSSRFAHQDRKCHGSRLFFAAHALQPDRLRPAPASTFYWNKNSECETVAISGLENRLLKTRWIWRRRRAETSLTHTLTRSLQWSFLCQRKFFLEHNTHQENTQQPDICCLNE